MYVCTRACICMHHFSGSFPGQPMLATIDLLSPSHMKYGPVIIILYVYQHVQTVSIDAS